MSYNHMLKAPETTQQMYRLMYNIYSSLTSWHKIIQNVWNAIKPNIPVSIYFSI